MILELAFLVYGSLVFINLLGSLYRPKSSFQKAKNVEFVMPTVADSRTLQVLNETISILKRKFPEYKIWLIVDEGSNLHIDGVELVVVPSSFMGKKCKGRALEYFRRNYVKKGTWYCFLDDDSYPCDDSFLYEIKYYEAKGYVGANGILVPREGKSKLSYVLDHIRLWDDLFLFRLFTGLIKRPYIGLHGELLILKGEVLKEIDFPLDSLAEDFHIAQQLVKKGYKLWHSSTRVSIKSPNSITDFWRQRARWFKGILKEFKFSKPMTIIIVTFRLIGRFFMFIVLVILWFIFPTYSPLVFIGLTGSLYYLTSYIYGIFKAKAWKFLAILPLLGIFEPLSFLYMYKIRDFVIIDKS